MAKKIEKIEIERINEMFRLAKEEGSVNTYHASLIGLCMEKVNELVSAFNALEEKR